VGCFTFIDYLNDAVTYFKLFIVIVHVGFVPASAQAYPHPANVFPVAGVAVKVIVVLAVTDGKQLPEQVAIPAPDTDPPDTSICNPYVAGVTLALGLIAVLESAAESAGIFIPISVPSDAAFLYTLPEVSV
jgi:hypothetical protein